MKEARTFTGLLFVIWSLIPVATWCQQSIVTLPPDSITSTSAVLRARVWTGGQQTTVTFRVTAPPMGGLFPFPTIQVPGDPTPQDVSYRISGLAPSYDYKILSRTSSSSGGEVHFITLPDSNAGGFEIFVGIRDLGNVTYFPKSFGVHTHATSCIDFGLGEGSLPPFPPQGAFDFRFVDDFRGNASCLELGMYRDIRSYNGTAQVDTYKVAFQPGVNGYPLILSWPDLRGHYSGPVRMMDPFGGSLFNVDMKAETTTTISSPFSQLVIVAEGPRNLISSWVESVSSNSVTMGAAFNPAGLQTEAWVEWGRLNGVNVTYESLGDAIDIGSGNAQVRFSCAANPLSSDTTYFLRVVTRNAGGTYAGVNHAVHTLFATGVASVRSSPTQFRLWQNYPNPFNSTTRIGYSIGNRGFVRLEVYDMLGRKAATLVASDHEPGDYATMWSAEGMSSGMYLCRLTASGVSLSIRLLLVR